MSPHIRATSTATPSNFPPPLAARPATRGRTHSKCSIFGASLLADFRFPSHRGTLHAPATSSRARARVADPAGASVGGMTPTAADRGLIITVPRGWTAVQRLAFMADVAHSLPENGFAATC